MTKNFLKPTLSSGTLKKTTKTQDISMHSNDIVSTANYLAHLSIIFID